jgi:hypothetical protein
MTYRVVALGSMEASDPRLGTTAAERLEMLAELSRLAWTASGRPFPEYERRNIRADVVAHLRVPPYRIDLLTSISGVEFDAAWTERVAGVRVPVLGRTSFIRNKRATGRTKDLADLEALGDKP